MTKNTGNWITGIIFVFVLGFFAILGFNKFAQTVDIANERVNRLTPYTTEQAKIIADEKWIVHEIITQIYDGEGGAISEIIFEAQKDKRIIRIQRVGQSSFNKLKQGELVTFSVGGNTCNHSENINPVCYLQIASHE